jgi:hypothetical protein
MNMDCKDDTLASSGIASANVEWLVLLSRSYASHRILVLWDSGEPLNLKHMSSRFAPLAVMSVNPKPPGGGYHSSHGMMPVILFLISAFPVIHIAWVVQVAARAKSDKGRQCKSRYQDL